MDTTEIRSALGAPSPLPSTDPGRPGAGPHYKVVARNRSMAAFAVCEVDGFDLATELALTWYSLTGVCVEVVAWP